MAKDEQALADPAEPQIDTALKQLLNALEAEKAPERILELARELERLIREK